MSDQKIPTPQLSDLKLTELQRQFVYWRAMGLSSAQAAKKAGYRQRNAVQSLTQIPEVQEGIRRLQKENRVRYDIDRDRVVEGIMEAISIARSSDDARTMIVGWTELARITGVQAPERKEMVHSHQLTDQIAAVSDDELLQLLDRSRHLDVIEGEVVDD